MCEEHGAGRFTLAWNVNHDTCREEAVQPLTLPGSVHPGWAVLGCSGVDRITQGDRQQKDEPWLGCASTLTPNFCLHTHNLKKKICGKIYMRENATFQLF